VNERVDTQFSSTIMSNNPGRRNSNARPSRDLMQSLSSRFVWNAARDDRDSLPMLMFRVEEAHWFYEDQVRVEHPHLRSMCFKEFAASMFVSSEALKPFAGDIDEVLEEFRRFKNRVPVAGTIILNETYDKCLLVKGWKSGAGWSFPKGKKNRANEEDHKCAIREVVEETGFDGSHLLSASTDFIRLVCGEKTVTLFIIGGVKQNIPFAPRTQKEISEIAWYPVHGIDTNSSKFFMVAQFLRPLHKWIEQNYKPASGDQAATMVGSSAGITSVWRAHVKHSISNHVSTWRSSISCNHGADNDADSSTSAAAGK
ncbi:hypothetical protein KI387_014662, partial [Taxus chinensis]